MTGPRRSAASWGVHALLLGLLFALGMALTQLVPASAGGIGSVAAVGFLLLAGFLAGAALEPLGVPHITGFLLAGAASGPHALGIVNQRAVLDLEPVNALALSLIALAGGAELRIEGIRRGLRSLGWATLLQSLGGLVLLGTCFAALRGLVPFARGMGPAALAGAALLWAVVAVSRSPAAVLGVLSQTRPGGPLTSLTLNFVMLSDVVVVLLFGAAVTVARPLLEPGAALSLAALRELGHELLGAIALGATLGLLLVAYMRFAGQRLLLVFLAIGLVLTEWLDYLRFDWLLIFLTAGFVVQNVSRQGERFLAAVEGAGEIVYVVFFAIAGAQVDLSLLAMLWPVALALTGSRLAVTAGLGWISGRLAGDPAPVRRWAWSGLVAQAGLSLGIAAKAESEFPALAGAFGALVLASVALNQLLGPIAFKVALDRTGETGGHGHGPAAEDAAAPEPGASPSPSA